MPNTIAHVIGNYSEPAKEAFAKLRNILLEEAKLHHLGDIEESLKWGEPSFKSKHGSPVRIHWRDKDPEIISIYVNCQSKLLDTYRQLYPDTFVYMGNRELQVQLAKPLAETALRHCFNIAMNYHKLKDKPLLGQTPKA